MVDVDQKHSFLDIRNVDLIYGTNSGPIHALKGFSLKSDAGEFVAVVGPSGCGKSSLLKVVAGPRREIGLMFQAPTLLPWKTVLENVLVPVRALRLYAPAYRDKAMNLLQLVGLEGFAGNYPGELSGGMQQRVSLARAVIHDPAVLLMDEPFAALDAMTREQMAVELQSLWMSARKSVVFITHHIPEAVFLADRVIVVSPRPGHVVEELKITLKRPRDIDTLADTHFVETCNLLRRKFNSN
jgi:NitT/TauT family transport system ATP-binding protein